MKNKGNSCGIKREKQIATLKIYLTRRMKNRSHQGIQDMKTQCFFYQN